MIGDKARTVVVLNRWFRPLVTQKVGPRREALNTIEGRRIRGESAHHGPNKVSRRDAAWNGIDSEKRFDLRCQIEISAVYREEQRLDAKHITTSEQPAALLIPKYEGKFTIKLGDRIETLVFVEMK